jgi:mono/diheme cytochrome c family protein
LKPAIFVLALTGALLPALAPSATSRFELPEGPGRGLIYGQCQTCHDLQSLVDSAGIPRGSWDAVLDNMREFGLRVDDLQRSKILDYLSTYLGPNPPAPAPDRFVSDTADGARVFLDVCAACHQEDGSGKENEFPPLAGNPDLFLSTRFPALVVLNGIEGPIEVGGRTFDNAMPPFDFLTDEEIATVINYLRGQWGNSALARTGVTNLAPGDIAELRAEPIKPADVRARRAALHP